MRGERERRSDKKGRNGSRIERGKKGTGEGGGQGERGGQGGGRAGYSEPRWSPGVCV